MKKLLPVLLAVFVLAVIVETNAGGFTHGIMISVDGEDYYMTGPADGPNGETDIPGHYWVQAGPKKVVGKHYNTGPFGAANWWSSDAGDGAFLFKVDGIIDEWTMEKAEYYISRGFVHYHELARVSDGMLHPSKVVWLKHIAVAKFNFDGGPHPELSHMITPGVDHDFIPNAMMAYMP